MLYMLIPKSGTRLESLKHREKYTTQEDIEKRDEVLSVDYEQYDYDLVILNDHREETVDKVIKKIKKELFLETMRTRTIQFNEPKKTKVCT